MAQTKCSTCQCFPRAVTTRSSIGLLKQGGKVGGEGVFVRDRVEPGGEEPVLAPAGPADGNTHLVVAAQAVELVQLVGRVARPSLHLEMWLKSP